MIRSIPWIKKGSLSSMKLIGECFLSSSVFFIASFIAFLLCSGVRKFSSSINIAISQRRFDNVYSFFAINLLVYYEYFLDDFDL